MNPYPAYKPSGVPWLGDVPEHWDVQRGKALFAPVDIRSATGNQELLTVSAQRGVIPRKSANVTMFKAESYVGYKLCWPGDLVINSLWAWAHGLGVSQHHGIVSSAYGVYRPLPRVNARFIHLLVRSVPFQWELQVRSKGIWVSRLQLTDESFLGAPFPLPPLQEQAAIVRYLDHADRRIRRYVNAKRKLIALLEEEKQAIINQAVIRGLDPNVPLKPSGVEWLGDMPEHWEVRRLSTSVESQINGVWGSDPDGTDDLPCIRVADFDRRHHRIRTDKLTLRSVKPSERSGRILRKGDLLLEKSGGGEQQPVGTVMLYDHDFQAVCSNFVGRMVLRGSYDPTYQTYLHATLYAIGVNKRSIKQTTGIQNIDASSYLSELVGVPPPNEQVAIARYLDKATADIDAAIARARRQVELLQEYRTRLIADVVTGKLDVREAAAHLPDEADDQDLLEEGGPLAESMDEDLHAPGEFAEELAMPSNMS